MQSGDVIRERIERVKRLNAMNEQKLMAVKAYYREHIAEFISDFGMTVDPRVAADGRQPFMPFVLFPKQVELVQWIMRHWREGTPGVLVKSRDVGASWIAMAVACSLCMFYRDMFIGFGSALEVKLDRPGDPDTLFYKGRTFVQYVPQVFRGAWSIDHDSPYMRILFPETGSSITGEAGDRMGRGGRKAIFFVDEAAHVERPQLIDRSLSATTNCRIDMSSVNGMANSFAERANSGKIDRFDFTWRDDPRKDDAWYEQKKIDDDPVTVAQEIDCSFTASAQGLLIEPEWIQAVIDADLKLKLDLSTGQRHGALDVADEGVDKNAFAARHGNVLVHAESWSGKRSDLFKTAEHAFDLCDEHGLQSFAYDNDGIGTSVKGDANVIAARRVSQGLKRITVSGFRGSGEVLYPEREMVKGRKNKDYFANAKAQAWWHLRLMFQDTYRALHGLPHNRDMLIAIRKSFKELSRLTIELSQPTYEKNTAGKILIQKTPPGTKSPNLADSVMMVYAPAKPKMRISESLFDQEVA